MPTTSHGPADRTTPRPADADATGRPRRAAQPPKNAFEQAWRSAGRRLPELRNELSWYAAVQADRARLAVGGVVRRIVLGVLLGLVGAAWFGIAAARLLEGIAGGLATALDGNLWLANVVSGATALLVLLGGAAWFERHRRNRRMQALQQRHARFEARDRALTAANCAQANHHA